MHSDLLRHSLLVDSSNRCSSNAGAPDQTLSNFHYVMGDKSGIAAGKA